MRTPRRLLLGLTALLLLAPIAARAQAPEDIVKAGKVVIAIDTTVPPYGSLDTQMQPTGMDVELAQLVGKSLGVPVEFVTVTSPGRIPSLLTKRVDMVISIFSITAERALQIDFTNPYGGQATVLLAPKGRKIAGPKDLVGLKVGATRGAIEDIVLTEIVKNNPGITYLRFDDGPSCAQAMLSGQIDAMGGGDYGEIYLRKSSTGDEFEQKFVLRPNYFGIGIRKNNPALLHWLNTLLFTLKNDGTLDRLSMKYRNKPIGDLPPF
jgi:polar amino acid transport system substrate-binding protein